MQCKISNVVSNHNSTHNVDAANHRITILKIAEQLKYATKEAPPAKPKETSYEPFMVDVNFDSSRLLNPTKEQIVKLLKRKFIIKLKMLKPFVDVMKYKTSSSGVSICPIASTSKLWNLHYGYQRQVARLIKCAKEIGLLYCVNESYSNRLGYCKEYAYDKRVEKKLMELFQRISHIKSITIRKPIICHINNRQIQPQGRRRRRAMEALQRLHGEIQDTSCTTDAASAQ